MLKKSVLFAALVLAEVLFAHAANYPAPVQGDYTVGDFKFQSGETLPDLRLHYMTIGTPVKDSAGVTRNAVLILHGTGGSVHAKTADQSRPCHEESTRRYA